MNEYVFVCGLVVALPTEVNVRLHDVVSVTHCDFDGNTQNVSSEHRN